MDAAMDAWRRRAANIVLVVVAAAHLPVFVLGSLGYGPPLTPLMKGVGLVVYLVLAAAAVLRPIDYRLRLAASFMTLYPAVALVSLGFPNGPYAQSGVVTMPIFALVLLGAGAGRYAIVASTIIVLSAPLLRGQPGVVQALGIESLPIPDPPGLIWFRTTVKAASLLTLMVLLDRFHRFLTDALLARMVAQRNIEREMRERQRLEREIAGVGDDERRRLGHELHDGVCQQITAALLRCQALERRLAKGGVIAGADFEPLSSLLADTINDAHDVARGLCPLEPHPEALAPALRAMARRTQELAAVPCEFHAVGDVRMPDPEAAQHLYRIAQEALSNAVQHAAPGRIAIELRGSNGELTLHVDDDGAGPPAELPGGGMGLRTMAYRAQIMGGHLTVGRAPGGGTRVACRVPRAAGALAAGLRV